MLQKFEHATTGANDRLTSLHALSKLSRQHIYAYCLSSNIMINIELCAKYECMKSADQRMISWDIGALAYQITLFVAGFAGPVGVSIIQRCQQSHPESIQSRSSRVYTVSIIQSLYSLDHPESIMSHSTGGCMRGSKRMGIETVAKNNGERIIKKL